MARGEERWQEAKSRQSYRNEEDRRNVRDQGGAKEKVIVVPNSTKAFSSLCGKALVGRMVDFKTLRTFNLLARDAGVNDMATQYISGMLILLSFKDPGAYKRFLEKDENRSYDVEAEILESDREDGEVGDEILESGLRLALMQIGAITREGFSLFNSMDPSSFKAPSSLTQGKKAHPTNSFLTQPRSRKRQRTDDPFDLNEIIGIIQTPASVPSLEPVPRTVDLNSRPMSDPIQKGVAEVVGGDITDGGQELGQGDNLQVLSRLEEEVHDTIGVGSLIGANLLNFRDEARSVILGEGFNGVSSKISSRLMLECLGRVDVVRSTHLYS
ncbi:hypothetical protein L1987_01036 [Smallanthus sonchifolius]|uniref:Uncharacterized protein n=1 Tax=Smallanthus sonchifolius TaxID=185202 RepID=A0ACB9K450_9ASTR|nr:hypothetical protein L1987_01036 [Smallanthus sonchifolius]